MQDASVLSGWSKQRLLRRPEVHRDLTAALGVLKKMWVWIHVDLHVCTFPFATLCCWKHQVCWIDEHPPSSLQRIHLLQLLKGRRGSGSKMEHRKHLLMEAEQGQTCLCLSWKDPGELQEASGSCPEAPLHRLEMMMVPQGWFLGGDRGTIVRGSRSFEGGCWVETL